MAKKPKKTEEAGALTIQGRHHYTRMKQVTELARLGETENQDMGFMARMLTLCSHALTPGTGCNTRARTAPYKLIMIAGCLKVVDTRRWKTRRETVGCPARSVV